MIFIFYVILLIVIILILFIYFKYFKALKLPTITIFTGGVKCGKTTLAVTKAISKYKWVHFCWWFKKTFLFQKDLEEPLLYSNIPLIGVVCHKVEREHLLRKKRFNYKSVVLISEACLVADSMNYKDKFTNDQLTLFCKLFGHETKGGCLFFETQAINDLHYALKRACSRYFYIYECIKWIPFILVFRVREMAYLDENTQNVFGSDIEDTMKIVLVFKSAWKHFDAYCYSIFTDNLTKDSVTYNGDLKTNEILRLRDFCMVDPMDMKGDVIDEK